MVFAPVWQFHLVRRIESHADAFVARTAGDPGENIKKSVIPDNYENIYIGNNI